MEASTDANQRAGPARRRPRVLIVDDDSAIRLVCATVLESHGYEVIEAANGEDALALARTFAPDAVLLDISMPVLDGFGVAAALRADEQTRALPFVFLTGEVDPHVVRRGHEVGAAGFLTKPFDPGAVAAFIRRIVERQQPNALVQSGGHAA